MSNNQTHPKSWLFIYLITLTIFFILLQISFFIQANHLYLGVFKIVTYHLKIPASVYPGIAYFLLMQLVIHLTYLLFIAGLTISISQTLKKSSSQTEKIGVTLWLLGIIIILLANQYFYPNSKFAVLTAIFFPKILAKIILIILSTLFMAMIAFAIYGIFKNKYFLITTTIFITLISIMTLKHPATPSAATATKPNIIIIGVDAVRPDYLGFFGSENHTPYFDDFFNHATVFSESLTPLARTYPAWISILTGQYPKKNGIRLDLAEQIHFDLQQTLPAILQHAGYQTIYATDETRFSNIDQRFGFDKTITPPIGFNDFLLGSLNDFPLSNLIINTPLGRYLFPYNYANRAAYITYHPQTFLNFMQSELINAHSKPIFLAVHFCLSHYPYIWSDSASDTRPQENYRQALQQVDQQLHGLLQYLKQDKLLEHSVIVILSDHGEALEQAGDRITDAELYVGNPKKPIPRFYPQSEYKEHVNQSGGHGTDILGLTQYHTLLAFQLNGTQNQSIRIISGNTSLLDIKPTLLNLLNLPDQNSDGRSLSNLITGKQRLITSQTDFFTETDFTPEAIRSVYPETRKVVFEGIEYIQINPLTTRLSIRPHMADLILSSKQYADFYGSWVMALYPQNKHWMMPVLVNLESGEWTTDLNTAFAKQAPTQHMLQALKNFYGNDISSLPL